MLAARTAELTRDDLLQQLTLLVEAGDEGAEDRREARFLLSMFEYSRPLHGIDRIGKDLDRI